MNRDLSLILSVVALCIACVVGSVLYKHTTDLQLHQPCVCPDGGCPEPKKPAPFKPRRPGGSTGEVGKVDGVVPRDM